MAACQHIATINDNVTAEMIDLQLFPELRESHHIMSVPTMIINNSDNVILVANHWKKSFPPLRQATRYLSFDLNKKNYSRLSSFFMHTNIRSEPTPLLLRDTIKE